MLHIIIWLAVAAVIVLVALAIAAFVLARSADDETRALGKRIVRLPWRRKLTLLSRLARDPAVPLLVRAIPPALVLYLAMPIDLIPDFIPVLGQLDDLIVVVAGVALLARMLPRDRLRAAIEAAEAPD